MAATGNAELAAALARSHEPAIVVDGGGRILHANRRFAFSTVSRGRTIGRHCFEICHNAERRCPGDECPLAAAWARMPLRRAVHIHRTAGIDLLTRIAVRPLTVGPSATYLMAFRTLNHVSAVPQGSGLVGRSAAFRRMVEQMDRVAEAPIPLLIVGEPGAGKEIVARTIHRMSRRRHEPFVIVDGPVTDASLAGQDRVLPHLRFGDLLGRVGEGTLFVDQVLGLTLFQQTMLLRLADAGLNLGRNVRRRAGSAPRLIAASETRLDALPPDTSFRADLADTLSIYPIEVPPLRDRIEDILLIAESVLLRLSVVARRAWRLTPAGAAYLQERDYPENVRELAYVVERAALAAPGDELGPDDFAFRDACLESGHAAEDGGRKPLRAHAGPGLGTRSNG